MPRRAPPPTIYTCISEPDKNSIRVIRYSADPRALDSLPTMWSPPPELVSKSRVAYRSVSSIRRFDDERLFVSCRGADRKVDSLNHDEDIDMPWLDNYDEAMAWLVGDID